MYACTGLFAALYIFLLARILQHLQLNILLVWSIHLLLLFIVFPFFAGSVSRGVFAVELTIYLACFFIFSLIFADIWQKWPRYTGGVLALYFALYCPPLPFMLALLNSATMHLQHLE